jgi:hypothetical protein
MSAPRLQLKQPTGWFAAGREFAQALPLLSDGAFKLYVHMCLRADRHTGQFRATVDELARATTRTSTEVALKLDELEASSVCRVIQNGGSQLVLEILDRFWPYHKQHTLSYVPEPEVEFVRKVRDLFLDQACVQASFSAADEKIAAALHRRGVSLEQVSRAILLGCARKYVSMLNAGSGAPITSLQYFADVVDEVRESPIPESYWEPLRAKVTRMEQQWLRAYAAKP